MGQAVASSTRLACLRLPGCILRKSLKKQGIQPFFVCAIIMSHYVWNVWEVLVVADETNALKTHWLFRIKAERRCCQPKNEFKIKYSYSKGM